MHRRDPLRKSVGLRSYLTALVALPVIICAALTSFLVTRKVDTANQADIVATRIQAASRLQVVLADVQNELMPQLAYTVVTSPKLRSIIGFRTTTAADAGLSPAVLGFLRGATDSDLARLARTPGQRAHAQRTRTQLAAVRQQIGSSAGLVRGFYAGINLSNRLANDAQSVVRTIRSASPSDAVVQAVRDTTYVNAAVQQGATELAYLAALKFPGLGATMSADAARSTWLTSWAGFTTASQTVLTKGGPATVRRWRAALASSGVPELNHRFDAYAANPALPLTAVDTLSMFRDDNLRSGDLVAAGNATSQQAIVTADRARSDAKRAAWLLAGLVALGLLLSLVTAAIVRRKIARPLRALSGQAEAVALGELVDVTADGPREVRTVARGLSAATASLRRIEAQAAAVASGDLDSDIVREPLPGPLGEVMHNSVTTIIDAIHERDLAQSDLAHQATHDSLTGLPNRHQALMSVGHALQRARRQGDLTALLFVDLDMFKVVNDSLGHAAGDDVLRVCAERMVDIVRDSDVVFRLGGDEFVILLEDISRDFPFVALAERLIAAIKQPIELERGTARVGACVGISLCQDASLDAERLLGEADAAAYSAKAAGRGRVGVYDNALRAALSHRAATEQAIAEALDNDQFVLHYQPVVDMSNGRPVGYEALIRWQHPTDGLLSPAQFIPIAEKTTLINRIGRWTLNEATRQLARWDADASHPSGLTVAVNISGRHLVATELVPDVRNALATSGVDPRRLVIEITETVLVDDPIALDNMQQLRDLGVVVAIDDFGTGYTSIGQLPKLPVDVLKIDRSFTDAGQAGHRELVRLIVGAAHAFGLSVVAEGVEEPAQADSLRLLHVDTGQGFYYAKPQPAAAASALASLPELPVAGMDIAATA